MDKYDIDHELNILKPLKFSKYTNSRRFFANLVFKITMFFTKPKKGIRERRFIFRGYMHQKVKLSVYEVKSKTTKSPGLLYIHGGGFQIQGTPVHERLVANIILETGQKAIYVDYRLAPKYPFPTALEDCYHALLWMVEHADFLNIDINDISIAGDSAGGNLAAGVALLARDRKGPKIHRQMLLYPVLDIEQQTESMKLYHDVPMWNSILNKDMWELYMRNGDYGMREYASPSLADVSGSPETYIETADYDCLRDEGILYAKRLKQAGVPVIEHQTKHTVHGYDAVFFSKLVRNLTRERILFLGGINHEKNQS
ncbi:MAG: alpha/beta hydrolase [Firmicutes bacterium]|nr:alpha/beta hydrolase [Bacillota bacterium]